MNVEQANNTEEFVEVSDDEELNDWECIEYEEAAK